MPDMTIDEIRTAIAVRKGWTPADGWWHRFDGDRIVLEQSANPVPASLDWVAEMMPKGWKWGVVCSESGVFAWASPPDRPDAFEAEAPTELHARLALLLAVLEAEGTR